MEQEIIANRAGGPEEFSQNVTLFVLIKFWRVIPWQ